MRLEEILNLRDEFLSFYKNEKIKKELEKEAEKESIEINNDFCEWFLFEKIFNDGETCFELFTLYVSEQSKIDVISSWKNFIFSIFKVKKITNDYYIVLNILNNTKYEVFKNSIKDNLEVGEYIFSRLLPIEDNKYIFTNNIQRIDTKSNDVIQSIAAKFELDYPHAAFTDNKLKTEVSYRIQFMEYDDFVDFFGSDEIIVEGSQIKDKLDEFYHYRYFQRKEKTTGKTIAKIFREKYGTYPELPIVQLPENIVKASYVGILYDKIEGLNFLPWYGVFREIFKNENFNEIPGYKQCVLQFLKSETISTLPFKRAVKDFPENSVRVFKDVLNRKNFELPEDFVKLMYKYKKAVMLKASEPSLIPIPEKIKALLRTKKTEDFVTVHLYESISTYKALYNLYKNIRENNF